MDETCADMIHGPRSILEMMRAPRFPPHNNLPLLLADGERPFAHKIMFELLSRRRLMQAAGHEDEINRLEGAAARFRAAEVYYAVVALVLSPRTPRL